MAPKHQNCVYTEIERSLTEIYDVNEINTERNLRIRDKQLKLRLQVYECISHYRGPNRLSFGRLPQYIILMIVEKNSTTYQVAKCRNVVQRTR